MEKNGHSFNELLTETITEEVEFYQEFDIIDRDRAMEKAIKRFENLESRLSAWASCGNTHSVIACGKSAQINDWGIVPQEEFKLLTERGFGPEIRERTEEDGLFIYHPINQFPYVIVVSCNKGQ